MKIKEKILEAVEKEWDKIMEKLSYEKVNGSYVWKVGEKSFEKIDKVIEKAVDTTIKKRDEEWMNALDNERKKVENIYVDLIEKNPEDKKRHRNTLMGIRIFISDVCSAIKD